MRCNKSSSVLKIACMPGDKQTLKSAERRDYNAELTLCSSQLASWYLPAQSLSAARWASGQSCQSRYRTTDRCPCGWRCTCRRFPGMTGPPPAPAARTFHGLILASSLPQVEDLRLTGLLICLSHIQAVSSLSMIAACEDHAGLHMSQQPEPDIMWGIGRSLSPRWPSRCEAPAVMLACSSW